MIPPNPRGPLDQFECALIRHNTSMETERVVFGINDALVAALARAEKAEASKVMMAIECQCEELRAENERYRETLRLIGEFKNRSVISNQDIFYQSQLAEKALNPKEKRE
jgi:hypothetical protein